MISSLEEATRWADKADSAHLVLVQPLELRADGGELLLGLRLLNAQLGHRAHLKESWERGEGRSRLYIGLQAVYRMAAELHIEWLQGYYGLQGYIATCHTCCDLTSLSSASTASISCEVQRGDAREMHVC